MLINGMNNDQILTRIVAEYEECFTNQDTVGEGRGAAGSER